MSPDAAVRSAPSRGRHLWLVPPRRLRVADVALLRGEGRHGIRAYLDAKHAHAQQTGAFEHHVLVPGWRAGALKALLRDVRPDVVLLHDPGWWPADVVEDARRLGARTVAVHHALPPGRRAAVLRPALRRTARRVDALMANADTRQDCGRHATIPLALGLDPAFRPSAGVRRGDHVLYVGRLTREHGLLELLEAAAESEDPWPLRLMGEGPLEGTLRARVRRLGLSARVSFRPSPTDPGRLARRMAAACCVVVPGEREAFGLTALQAAACGTPVAACATTPALRAVGTLGHRFVPGDPSDLRRAIADARDAPSDPERGAAIAWHHSWDRRFAQELEALQALVA